MSKLVRMLSPREYIDEATRLINSATVRVSLVTMIITHDDSTNKLIEALTNAAKRGVKVDVAADMFTYTELSGQFIPSHYYSKKVRSATRTANQLTAAGANFHWLGRVSLTTFSERTHIKWCVVDNAVLSFGGVNTYKEAVENTDYMFEIHDSDLADHLLKEHHKIVRSDKGNFAYKSHEFASKWGAVLIDGGLVGNSIIYKRACELAEQSESVLLVSQYCPTGKLSKLLKKTDSALYFNPWQNATGFNRLIIRIGTYFSHHSSLYKRRAYLHSKFMIFTLRNGEKIAITGSHNFVRSGVLLGTREIALETTKPAIINKLEKFFEDQVA